MTIPRTGFIKVKGHVLQQISIDPQGGCLYLQFSGEKVVKTIEHTDFINLDLDRRGKLQIETAILRVYADLLQHLVFYFDHSPMWHSHASPPVITITFLLSSKTVKKAFFPLSKVDRIFCRPSSSTG